LSFPNKHCTDYFDRVELYNCWDFLNYIKIKESSIAYSQRLESFWDHLQTKSRLAIYQIHFKEESFSSLLNNNLKVVSYDGKRNLKENK
jgi:hypothetical protein